MTLEVKGGKGEPFGVARRSSEVELHSRADCAAEELGLSYASSDQPTTIDGRHDHVMAIDADVDTTWWTSFLLSVWSRTMPISNLYSLL